MKYFLLRDGVIISGPDDFEKYVTQGRRRYSLFYISLAEDSHPFKVLRPPCQKLYSFVVNMYFHKDEKGKFVPYLDESISSFERDVVKICDSEAEIIAEVLTDGINEI